MNSGTENDAQIVMRVRDELRGRYKSGRAPKKATLSVTGMYDPAWNSYAKLINNRIIQKYKRV